MDLDFQKRLEKAIERGYRAGDAKAEAEAKRRLGEQELRGLHTQYRLAICEHIEKCLRQLPDLLPGFDFELVVSERGWGAAVSRNDIVAAKGQRATTRFSRMEVVIRPINSYFLLEIAAKATVRNRELFNRTHYEQLADTDLASFTGLIDLWVLEFAELYASKS
jgi:hypothetical protein